MVNNMVARQVDGLIVASSMLNDADYQKLSEQLPVVLFDRHMNDSSLPLVITDSITPTAKLVADIARQHPDEFYFLGGQPRLSPRATALKGLNKVCATRTLRCARSGSFTEIITRVPVTRCSPNSVLAWGVRQKPCSPPPAACWKGCCATWGSTICCKVTSG